MSAGNELNLLDMVWPETGLQVTVSAPVRARDTLSENDRIALEVDFLTLSLSPLEFVQLAASLRLGIDGLLGHHPAMQRAVVAAFDIRD